MIRNRKMVEKNGKEEKEKMEEKIEAMKRSIEGIREKIGGAEREEMENKYREITGILTEAAKIVEEENGWLRRYVTGYEREIEILKNIKEERKRNELIEDIKKEIGRTRGGAERSYRYGKIVNEAIEVLGEMTVEAINKMPEKERVTGEKRGTEEAKGIIGMAGRVVVPKGKVGGEPRSGSGKMTCRYKCEECGRQEEAITYCVVEERCHRCNTIRKEEKRKVERETRREIAEERREENERGKIIGDQYYFVTLTVGEEDGSEKHVIEELKRNWRKMTPPSTMAKGKAYVIERTEGGRPHLHGLIRYNGIPVPFKMCPSSAIFKNEIRKEGTKEKNERRKVIEKLTKHRNKRYETEIEEIREKWEYMTKEEEAIGAKWEEFII